MRLCPWHRNRHWLGDEAVLQAGATCDLDRVFSVENAGVRFTECLRCGKSFVCDESGRWRRIPAGYRVVWRTHSEQAVLIEALAARIDA